MSTPQVSINTNFCLQLSNKAPTLYKDQIFCSKNWSHNKKKWYMTKVMHACARTCTHIHTHTQVKPKNLAVILKPKPYTRQKKSNKTEFSSTELNSKIWW